MDMEPVLRKEYSGEGISLPSARMSIATVAGQGKTKASSTSTVVPARTKHTPPELSSSSSSSSSSSGDTTTPPLLSQDISEESLVPPDTLHGSSPPQKESSKSYGSMTGPYPTRTESLAHYMPTNSNTIIKEFCEATSRNPPYTSPPSAIAARTLTASQRPLTPILTVDTIVNELQFQGSTPLSCSSCASRGGSIRTCCIVESSVTMLQRKKPQWDGANDALTSEKSENLLIRLTGLFTTKNFSQLIANHTLKSNSRISTKSTAQKISVSLPIVKEQKKAPLRFITSSAILSPMPSRTSSSAPAQEHTTNESSYIGNAYQSPPPEDLLAYLDLFDGQPLPLSIEPPRPNSISAITSRDEGWVAKRTIAILPEINTSISEIKMPSASVLELSPLLSELIKSKILYENASVDSSHNGPRRRVTWNNLMALKEKYEWKHPFSAAGGLKNVYDDTELSKANKTEEAKKKMDKGKEMERGTRDIIEWFYSSERPYQRPHMDAAVIRSRFEKAGPYEATSSSHPDLGVKFQIPEAIIETSDLEWREDGSLAITGTAARELMVNAVLWLPYSDDVVEEYDLFSKLPTTEHILESDGKSVDIMRTHLAHGRWTWITESLGVAARMQINVEKTAEFDDARVFLLRNPEMTGPLTTFSHRRPFTDMDIPRNLMAVRTRCRLQAMILESSHAALDEYNRFHGSPIMRPRDPNLVWKIGLFAGPNVRLAKAIRVARAKRDEVPVPDTSGQGQVWTATKKMVGYLKGARPEKQTDELDSWEILEQTAHARRQEALNKIAEQKRARAAAEAEAQAQAWDEEKAERKRTQQEQQSISKITNDLRNLPETSAVPYVDPCPGRKGKGLAERYPWPEKWPEYSAEPASEASVEGESTGQSNCAKELPNISSSSSSISLFRRIWSSKRVSSSSDSSTSPQISVRLEQPKAHAETGCSESMPLTPVLVPAKWDSVEAAESAAPFSTHNAKAKDHKPLTLLNSFLRLNKPAQIASSPSISPFPATGPILMSGMTLDFLLLPPPMISFLPPSHSEMG